MTFYSNGVRLIDYKTIETKKGSKMTFINFTDLDTLENLECTLDPDQDPSVLVKRKDYKLEINVSRFTSARLLPMDYVIPTDTKTAVAK